MSYADMSKPGLKAALTRATKQVAGLTAGLEAAVKERDEAKAEAELKAATASARWGTIQTLTEKIEKLEEARDDALAEAGQLRYSERTAREAMLRAQAERERDRAYVTGLLDGTHPRRPPLPWEGVEFSEVHSHYSPEINITGDRR